MRKLEISKAFSPRNARALRSVEDRFLRKEEAVGSNPTGSILFNNEYIIASEKTIGEGRKGVEE